MMHLIHAAIHVGAIVPYIWHHHRVWISRFDGQAWQSAYDALMHIIRSMTGG